MVEKVKLAYLIDTIASDTAGTEKQLLETIRRLDRPYFSPLLICLWESRWMRENRLPCPYLPLGYKGFIKPNFPKVIWKLARILESERIDIVQIYFEDSIFVGFLGKVFSRRSVKLLSSKRDIGLGKGNHPWYHSLYSVALPFVNRYLSGIVANSEEVKKYVAKRERVNPEKIKVIYNGISIPRKPDFKPSIFETHERVTWITMVASLTPVKRHDLLLKAVAELIRRNRRIHVKILLLGDGPEKAKLEAMATSLGIRKHLIFEGAVKNVTSYLCNSDIGVLCSDREGLSNAIMEYMACGLPVVATSVGGNLELIDETTGILVAPGDHMAFADALEQLVTKPQLRKKMGEAGKRKIEENFSWEKTIDELQNYYISLLNNCK